MNLIEGLKIAGIPSHEIGLYVRENESMFVIFPIEENNIEPKSKIPKPFKKLIDRILS